MKYNIYFILKKKFKILFILLILLILILIIINFNIIKIYFDDIFFQNKKRYIYSFDYNKNLINEKNNCSKEKILIISFDNRDNLKYIKLHNNNIKKYCKKHKNIYYKFINKLINKNIYWNKLYLVLQELNSNKYDYVMWMDTDSFIINNSMSLHKIINLYSSDILIGHDNLSFKNIFCAGVFIIKNSIIGKKFIKDCINYYEKSECKKEGNKLHGLYAGKCYEQGVMNYYIYEKYMKFTTIVKPSIFNNTYDCNKNTFILHKFNSSEKDLIKCIK
jgi:hypothetical protein